MTARPAAPIRLVETLCGGLAAAALLGIMVLTAVDVTGRKFLAASVPGSLEMTELLMVTVIFAALPLVSLHREHVVFDSLDPLLPPWVRRVQQFAVELLCGALLAGLAWVLAVKAGRMAGYGDLTAQLGWPLAPFVYGMSALCALTAAMHGVLAWRGLRAPAASAA